jgi:hypothetical protein
MFSPVRLRTLRWFLSLANTEDVGNHISTFSVAAFRFHSESYLDMWLILGVRIVLWIFSQSLTRAEGNERLGERRRI